MKRSHMALSVFLFTVTVLAAPGSDIWAAEPPPEISLTTKCLNGLTMLTVSNSGGPMTEPAPFEVVFADGERDTLFIQVESNASVSCRMSNVHGGMTVISKEHGTSAKADDCLVNTLSTLLAHLDLASLIPSPMGEQDLAVCSYTIFIKDFKYDAPTFELIRKNGQPVLKYVFRNIRGNIKATGSSWACTDLSGNFKVAAVISETTIIIDEGGNPEVSLGPTVTTVQGLQVNIAGTLGFVADWILDFFKDTMTTELGRAIEAELNKQAGSDLGNLLTVRSGCE